MAASFYSPETLPGLRFRTIGKNGNDERSVVLYDADAFVRAAGVRIADFLRPGRQITILGKVKDPYTLNFSTEQLPYGQLPFVSPRVKGERRLQGAIIKTEHLKGSTNGISPVLFLAGREYVLRSEMPRKVPNIAIRGDDVESSVHPETEPLPSKVADSPKIDPVDLERRGIQLVSRAQTEIIVIPDQNARVTSVLLMDPGSTNGTFIATPKEEPVRLDPFEPQEIALATLGENGLSWNGNTPQIAIFGAVPFLFARPQNVPDSEDAALMMIRIPPPEAN